MRFFSTLRGKLLSVLILLLSVLTLGLSYFFYQQQWFTLVKQSNHYHKNLSLSFSESISVSMEGNNYANIYLPTFVQRLQNTKNLIHLEAKGLTRQSKNYQFSYNREIGETWRTYYPSDFEKELTQRTNRLKNLLASPNTDKIKAQFLLQQAEEKLDFYYKQQSLALASKDILSVIPYLKNGLNTKYWLLMTTIPTENSNGGHIQLIYDVSDLKTLKKNAIYSATIIYLISTLIFVAVISIGTSWVIRPIERLTKHINDDLKNTDINSIPSINANDEIGDLARKFKTLLANTYLYLDEMEESSYQDPLTSLFNRRYYKKIISELINQSNLQKKTLSFIFIDIDNFKKYNDNYGHDAGDDVLIKIGQILTKESQILTKKHHESDKLAFRFGGEEFLFLCNCPSSDDGVEVANQLKMNIEAANIEHLYNNGFGHITASIGVCSLINTSNHQDDSIALKYADEALYRAKSSGRNRVCQKHIGKPDSQPTHSTHRQSAHSTPSAAENV